jgi:filamentous hemagglutinin
MWSSNGNIDAGRGSKTASSTPPPLVVVDLKTGAFTLDATQSIVGSGIRVLLGNKNVVPGTVDLFAPTGEINAGDAGIGAAGNIFLGALHVVGADNINFGGTSAGVPVAAPPPVTVSGMGNMQDASKAADQATQSLSAAKEDMESFKPTFLSVEVIGLGDESTDMQQ